MAEEKDYANKTGKMAFLFSMVFSLGFIVFISFFHPGANLDEVQKDAIKKANMDLAKNGGSAEGSPAFDPSSATEPWVESEGIISHGATVYKTNCAVCHGNTGKGDGPAGMALKPPPRNLIEGKWTVGGDRVSLHKTLTEGIEGTSMAAFAHISNVDRWAMVHYIRSITDNKVSDDDGKVAEYGKTTK